MESRPHNFFCEEQWWEDMDVILEEAEKRGMRVWILDDKHFPTGYANGLIPKKYPHLRKWQLIEEHVDVIGPAPESAILLSDHASGGAQEEADILLGVYAYKRSEEGENILGEPIDLTQSVKGRYVYWDIPKGVYRVFALYKSRRGADKNDYIHMIDPESVRVLIEAVYEPHYARYKRYFGNTLAGFFSDEPSFGNVSLDRGGASPSFYDHKLGQPALALPWTDEVLCRMEKELGKEALPLLPALWYTLDDGMPDARIAYMNAVTLLWREAFSMQLGSWCRERGVEYIGHIIEDMNAHARLYCSGGHYFRSLEGQDMAGIDVVLHQIIPGMAHHIHASIVAGGMADSAFFDYVLARLAASLAHIESRMKGRAMCEIFGAYGWAEGVPMMTHLLDHMLVRGINYFVPHAFSPKFPDPDCPPHFNAGGNNPQFAAYAELMRYGNKVCHLLEGGTEVVSAAILYHAEAEWSGKAYMLIEKPAKALYDAQHNYDFLPIDALLEKVEYKGGSFRLGDMIYPVLIVPYAEYLPQAMVETFARWGDQGAPILYVNGRPSGLDKGEVVPLSELANRVGKIVGYTCRSQQPFDFLRHFHVRRGETDIFMLVNENMTEDFQGGVFFPNIASHCAVFDFMRGTAYKAKAHQGIVELALARGQSLFMLPCSEEAVLPEKIEPSRAEILQSPWTLALKRFDEDEFSAPKPIARLYNITGMDGNDTFSGFMRYETAFAAKAGAVGIDLGIVGECCDICINGEKIATLYDAPYTVLREGLFREGENTLSVTVSNSLVHAVPDPFSRFVQIPPSGLLGEVKILYK